MALAAHASPPIEPVCGQTATASASAGPSVRGPRRRTGAPMRCSNCALGRFACPRRRPSARRPVFGSTGPARAPSGTAQDAPTSPRRSAPTARSSTATSCRRSATTSSPSFAARRSRRSPTSCSAMGSRPRASATRSTRCGRSIAGRSSASRWRSPDLEPRPSVLAPQIGSDRDPGRGPEAARCAVRERASDLGDDVLRRAASR
jgi:hypothetical protein